MKKWLHILMLAVVILAGCSSQKNVSIKNGKPVVVATTGQIADAIQRIGGDHVQVIALMGPGVDPHLYKATQSDLSKLHDAQMIFYNGLHLEGQMLSIFDQMANDKTVVAVGEQIGEARLLTDEEGATPYDPHIWFDITIWKEVVGVISDALTQKYPEHTEDFNANEKAFSQELDQLQQYATERVDEIPETQRILVTAHDAFNYFGKSLGFEVRGLQGLSTDSEYGVKDVQQMVDFLVKHQIKAIYIESSVSDKAMNAVIEGAKQKGHTVIIGGELFSDAMGAEGMDEGTYIGMYRHNIDTIVDSLK